MAQLVGEDPVIVEVGEEIPFWNTWCNGCINAKDKRYDDIAPISYYCQKRGFRVPAFHPTVDCKDYANNEKGA